MSLTLARVAVDSPEDHIRRCTLGGINHFLSAPELPVYRDLKRLCERVSDTYRDRVVLELLQNAHDAHAPDASDGRIKLWLDPHAGPFGTLMVANGGLGFDYNNFEKLCSPGDTTKTVNEAIGNKGVGFLSVFQVSSYPEVYSRDTSVAGGGFDGFCFRFGEENDLVRLLASEDLEHQTALVAANMPRLYLACPTASIPATVEGLAFGDYATVVCLPLKSTDAREAVDRQLSALMDGGTPVQLFLSRIAELRILSPALGAEDIVLTRSSDLLDSRDGFSLHDVACGASRFIVARQSIREHVLRKVIHRDVKAGHLPEAWDDWEGDGIVSLAVAADGPPLNGRLYNFLPMGAESASPFAGHLDAPFYTTIDRQRLAPNVELNATLMMACRQLALDGALAATRCLPDATARAVAADLLFWSGDGRIEVRDRLIASGTAVIPAVRVAGRAGWAQLDQVRLWEGDDFLTPAYAAKVAHFHLVDPAIGEDRVRRLKEFTAGTGLLNLPAEQRADIVVAIADDLLKRRGAAGRWDRYYASLAKLFRDDASSLAGRRLLLTDRGDLAPAETRTERRGGRGKRRLSAIFFPSLRGREDGAAHVSAHDFPLAVQRRIAFLNPKLECSRDGVSASRRFLLTNGLVREHESREILRLLAGAVAEPGAAKDPEAVRWAALTAMMRIVADEDLSAAAVAEISMHVPARRGWIRAGEALFGAWPGTAGRELEDLFERAAGCSIELDDQAGNLLRAYADWRIAPGDRQRWVTFLTKAGVVDHLRAIPAFSGPPPRDEGRFIARALAQRSPIGRTQRDAWHALMSRELDHLPNQWTPYSAREVYRLPGQADHPTLAPIAGKPYALQVIRMLEAQPALLEMTLYRPLHSWAPNTREWPSPAGAFVRTAAWLPLASGQLVSLDRAWLPGNEGHPPPKLPILDHDARRLLSRGEAAQDILVKFGLSEFGAEYSAWRLLRQAGPLIEDATAAQAERLLVACQEAWQAASLDGSLPEDLHLVGRRASMVCSVDPRQYEGRILVADGDDRRMLTAIARAAPRAFIFEPPSSRAREIAVYLMDQLPGRFERISEIRTVYEIGGSSFSFDPGDPLITTELGSTVADLAALTFRYRCTFYRAGHAEALLRLASLRIRWVDAITLRVGDITAPLPGQAALVRAPQGDTLLAPAALRGSPTALVTLAEPLGEAMGSRKTIGEPLLAAAALLADRSPTIEALSQVFDAPVEEIRGVLRDARSAGPELARMARPFLQLWSGRLAAAALAPGEDLLTEDELVAAIDAAMPLPPITGSDLIQRCRECGGIEALALALDVDLAALNGVLADLGPPYQVIDRTAEHQDTLAAFLQRREALIRESVRSAFRPVFEAGDELAGYVAARDAPRVTLPEGIGQRRLQLPQAELDGWLRARLDPYGVTLLDRLPVARSSIESVREANIRQCRTMVSAARVAVLAKEGAPEELRVRYLDEANAEAEVIRDAQSGGWIDFDRLDQSAMLQWWERAGLWPSNWGYSLAFEDLGISAAEREAIREEDRRRKAPVQRKRLAWSGGDFVIGETRYGSVADAIVQMANSNSSLLSTGTRTLKGQAGTSGHGGRPAGGSGGGTGRVGGANRMADDEKDVIGFFGEAIAFAWLKARFGRRRIIDEGCWKSSYRCHVYAGEGNDGLGYDLEVRSGKAVWFFEVKATSATDIRPRHTVELGSTEIARAELCKAEQRTHYRILQIVDALHPEQARILVLPNPRSDEGLIFYAEQSSAGVRLQFPLPPD